MSKRPLNVRNAVDKAVYDPCIVDITVNVNHTPPDPEREWAEKVYF